MKKRYEGLRSQVVLAPETGFTLIELLIVVAIILIIAAIAIPNFLRSKLAANQASAVGSMRTLASSEVTYASTYDWGFSPQLSYLGPPSAGAIATSIAAGLVDSVLAGGGNTSTKSGYSFTYHPGKMTGGKIYSFALNGDPVTRGYTGINSYFVDESGVIRATSNGTPATSTSSPLGE